MRGLASVSVLGTTILLSANVGAAFASSDEPGRMSLPGALQRSLSSAKLEAALGGSIAIDVLESPKDFMGKRQGVTRLRGNLTVTYNRAWRVKVDREFEDVRKGWRNLWVQYRGRRGYRLKVGQSIAPFAMESMMASRDRVFMRPALPSALTPKFRVGAVGTRYERNWSASLGVFGNPIDDSSKRDNGLSVIFRGTVAPVRRKGRLLHLGAALEQRDLDDGATTRIRSRQEVSLAERSFLNTGTLRGVKTYTNANLEAVWAKGSMLFLGQIAGRRTQFADRKDIDAWGAQVTGAWVIGGLERRYSSAAGGLTSPRLTSPGVPEGWGALELAARVSSIDLSSGFADGGQGLNLALAANWYARDGLKVSVNAVNARALPNRFGERRSKTALMARLQVSF